MKILIIIVTWNKKKYVLDLLSSLKNISDCGYLYDILVIDNASQDGTVEAIKKQFPDAMLLVNDENLGGTGGFNTGFKFAFSQKGASYKYLWLLDNDVVVHKDALKEMVRVLDENDDVAICGSSMLQLDFPWRINELGAFVKIETGELILYRHLFEILAWQGRPLKELLSEDPRLSRFIFDIGDYIDVDYVAAASMLVRRDVALKAGLWDDFFIHFDDIDWCLRIQKMGYRVTVSTSSLIWHLSAINKVPTWEHYYDTRNNLYMIKTHGKRQYVRQVVNRQKKRAVYYGLIGKQEVSDLIIKGIRDFKQNKKGKAEIKLPSYHKAGYLYDFIVKNNIKTVLISMHVNLLATKLQPYLCKLQKRHGVKIHILTEKGSVPLYWLPMQRNVYSPQNRLLKAIYCIKRHKSYDLVIQSDYLPLIYIQFLGKYIAFANDNGISIKKTNISKNIQQLFKIINL